MATTFYKSSVDDAFVKAVDDDTVFVKQNGTERKSTYDSKIVTNAMMGKQISKEDYNKA